MEDWKKLHPQYEYATLGDSVPRSPWELWSLWIAKAQERVRGSKIYINEIAIASCGSDLIPSVRMVLLKEAGPAEGFCWYTNKNSEKGIDIAQNPRAELLWYFSFFHQQIRIKGQVDLLPRDKVIKYARSRPLQSQLSAYISKQSRKVESREALHALYKMHEKKFENPQTCPVSDEWAGYSLVPFRFEFWQGRPNRLHERIIYTTDSSSKQNSELLDPVWKTQRLYP